MKFKSGDIVEYDGWRTCKFVRYNETETRVQIVPLDTNGLYDPELFWCKEEDLHFIRHETKLECTLK